jgi:hypothetical protein
MKKYMDTFGIEFELNNEIYTASVTRIGSGPVQYHITQIDPYTELFPECIIMTWNYERNLLEWGIDMSYNPLINHQIANSIFRKLNELNIPLF